MEKTFEESTMQVEDMEFNEENDILQAIESRDQQVVHLYEVKQKNITY